MLGARLIRLDAALEAGRTDPAREAGRLDAACEDVWTDTSLADSSD